MKDKKQKICFDKRYLLLLVAGFLTGRVWLYGINPFGVALFAAVAAERKGRKLLALFVLAGMFSSTEGLSLIKYLTLFLLILSLEKIQEKWTSHTGQAVYLALLTGGLNMAAGILNSILAVNTWEVFWLSILESVMVFALANVYQWGVHFILYEEWNQLFNNEELISLLILAVTALYGLPRQADIDFFHFRNTFVFHDFVYGIPVWGIDRRHCRGGGRNFTGTYRGKYGGCRHMLSARCVCGDAA